MVVGRKEGGRHHEQALLRVDAAERRLPLAGWDQLLETVDGVRREDACEWMAW